MISLLTVVGARPQFIKASMLSRAIASAEEIPSRDFTVSLSNCIADTYASVPFTR